MKSNPIGGLFGDKIAKQQTYANVALESLASLDTTKNIFLSQNLPYINQTILTKQFSQLLNIIYNYSNDACTLDIINCLNNYATSKNEQNGLYQYPYNFLTYFLLILDEEYKQSSNIQKIEHNSSQDIEKIASEIKKIIDSKKISLISENYFFTIIINNKCNACGTSKYDWAFKRIIDLEVDKYKEWKKSPISLSECLQYYTYGKNINCQNCGNYNNKQTRLIYNTGKVLIINLIKNNLTGQTDPNFQIDININISNLKKDPNLTPKYNTYTLKSRILYGGPQFGFFVDCFIKRDNMQGVWYRYMNESKREIQLNEINQYCINYKSIVKPIEIPASRIREIKLNAKSNNLDIKELYIDTGNLDDQEENITITPEANDNGNDN